MRIITRLAAQAHERSCIGLPKVKFLNWGSGCVAELTSEYFQQGICSVPDDKDVS